MKKYFIIIISILLGILAMILFTSDDTKKTIDKQEFQKQIHSWKMVK